jgi:hypothetical protein
MRLSVRLQQGGQLLGGHVSLLQDAAQCPALDVPGMERHDDTKRGSVGMPQDDVVAGRVVNDEAVALQCTQERPRGSDR